MGGRDLMAGAKVFGHLYAVTFETGAIKVGMSRSGPQSRIRNHRNAGAQFGVSVFGVLVVNIYTPDVTERESTLCALLQLAAKQTAGREWFKFESKEAAANFAASNMPRIEAESYAARPSVDQIELAATKKNAATEVFLDRFFRRAPKREISESRLCAIRAFLCATGVPVGGDGEAMLVELFFRFEELVTECGDDMSSLPESANGLYYGDIDYEMAMSSEEINCLGTASRSITEFLGDVPLQVEMDKKFGGLPLAAVSIATSAAAVAKEAAQ